MYSFFKDNPNIWLYSPENRVPKTPIVGLFKHPISKSQISHYALGVFILPTLHTSRKVFKLFFFVKKNNISNKFYSIRWFSHSPLVLFVHWILFINFHLAARPLPLPSPHPPTLHLILLLASSWPSSIPPWSRIRNHKRQQNVEQIFMAAQSNRKWQSERAGQKVTSPGYTEKNL